MAGRRWIDLHDLPPEVFAAVMATGIVSIAAQDHDDPRISAFLAAVATVVFVVLVARILALVLARPNSPFGRLRDLDVVLRLFTFVAACAVLGVRFVDHPNVVTAAGVVGAAAWLVLVPLCIRAVRSRRLTALRDDARGTWLLASVATAGLAITAADLGLRNHRSGWVLLCALAWVLAVVLYVVITGLILWRAAAAPFVPDQAAPDSWILMGALAITTLAGNRLFAVSRTAGSAPWLTDATRPAIRVLWVLASLWIPILVYASVWRADHRPGSLRFAGIWWSAVFPLGMYSAATQATALQLHVRSLRTISLVFFWIALAVWLFVAVGWLRALVRTRRTPRDRQTGRTGNGRTAPARRLRRSQTRRVPST